MKKRYLQAFINSVEHGSYTLEQLYDEFKYFCEQNIIPKSSIAMFRTHLETLDNINITYDANGIKIKLITIS